MDRYSATVAITGMNATDNPAPGVGVARSLRHESGFHGRLLGLGYDALDPGFYASGLLDGGAILPYPSAGKQALWDKLQEVHRTFGIDVIIPTLDSELRAFIPLAPELSEIGIHTYLPTLEALDRSSKPALDRLRSEPELRIPESETVTTADQIARVIKRFGLPVAVKGPYYGSALAHTEDDAIGAFHHFVASWGVPVILQRFVGGEEYNVAAVGDGTGSLVGAVAMRKMALTDKGKGWSGITVENPALIDVARAVVSSLKWRGPLEVEILRESSTGKLYVLEINPRFPAWIYLSAGAGQNLAFACVALALGDPIPPLERYRAGTLFVRISIDQISDLDTYEQLTASGLLRRKASGQ